MNEIITRAFREEKQAIEEKINTATILDLEVKISNLKDILNNPQSLLNFNMEDIKDYITEFEYDNLEYLKQALGLEFFLITDNELERIKNQLSSKSQRVYDLENAIQERNKESNKGDFGYVAIMGGCENYSGAIKLANMSCSAIRAGCGVIRLIIPKAIVNSVSPYLLEQTIYSVPDDNSYMIFDKDEIDKALDKIKALAIKKTLIAANAVGCPKNSSLAFIPYLSSPLGKILNT